MCASLLCGCHSHTHEHEHDHGHDHGHSHEQVVTEEAEHDHDHDHDHEGITLHNHSAELFGVSCEAVEAGTFHNVIRSWGRVVRAGADDAVVSAPTSGIVTFAAGINPGKDVSKGSIVATIDASGVTGGNPDAALKVALDNARIELERVQKLYNEKLATTADLQAAKAAVAAAETAYSPAASSGRATAPIAGTITALNVKEGQYVQAGEVIASIGKGDATVVRVDVPKSLYSKIPEITDLIIDIPGQENFSVVSRSGRRLGSVPAGESSDNGAYIPVYFSLPASGLPAGESFTAYLVGKERQNVITLPVSALSEQQGKFYVYEQHEGEHFDKRPVTLGDSDGLRVEILEGVEPGDVIVTTGVQAVRLAETSAVAPQGHTHNH